VVPLKALASALTIGTGGSAGQEGPVAQVGGGIGSWVAQRLELTKHDRRIFLLAGSSAGISAMFQAPLGAALFAPEVLYRKPELEGEAIVPCIISSIVAYTTYKAIHGDARPVAIPAGLAERLTLSDPRELGLYLVLAIACALASLVFTRTFHGLHRLSLAACFLPAPLKPALGGLALALLALAIAPWCGANGVLFGGYELMSDAIAGRMALGALALLAFAKMLATSFTNATGGSGGVFAPSLAIGALVGALVGEGGRRLFPALGVEPACYALVGMGGFFAGLAKVPLAAILIVCEMTRSYGLLAPLMLVAVVHLLLARRWTIYETQVGGLVDSPAHAGEFVVDVLETLRVRDVLGEAPRPTLIRADATMRAALDAVSRSRDTIFPVVDGDERLVGIFGLSDVRRIFQQMAVADLVIVRDFMVENVVTTTPSANLSDALHALNAHGLHALPVVDEADPRRVVAMLERRRVGEVYQQRLDELKKRA
jgi:CIC family chloride channel protein